MHKLKFTLVIVSGLALMPLSALAQSDAEALVASKAKADMTYRELMQILGRSLTWIQSGIVQQNKQLVREGANHVLHHPAPNHKPWTIMAKEDQEGFKQALLGFDPVLDIHAKDALAAAEKGDWFAASEASSRLQSACVSCHAEWQKEPRR